MHLESRREEVEHRDPHRGIQPRCMTEVRGKSADGTQVRYIDATHALPSTGGRQIENSKDRRPDRHARCPTNELAMEEAYHGDK